MYLLKEIIECFKTEALADKEKVIRLQGQLLVRKDEKLKLLMTSVEETVQTTVESGIQSYSAAVQHPEEGDEECGCRGGQEQEPDCVWAERRGGRTASSASYRSFGGDRGKPHFEATRVGWKRPGSTAIRPVKITVPSSTAVHQILIKTGRLRETHKDVWICPDRSSEERATRKHLVTDLKKKRAEQSHLDHYIRYGKVCSRDKKSS